MNDAVYRCSLGTEMQAFLGEVLAKGYQARHIRSVLKEFDEFMVAHYESMETVTLDMYDDWFETISQLDKHTIYQKSTILIRFFKYLVSIGHDCCIPPTPRWFRNDYVPHIYTHEEITKLLAACDSLRLKENVPSSCLMAIPAIVRTLYSTGIRIGEALSIRNIDVDFDRHCISINKTKNGRQRLAPINKSLEEVIRQYISYRNRIPLDGIVSNESPLFVNGLGNRILKCSVSRWFIIALETAGIRYKGNGEGPRLHDLRHTAAVRAFEYLVSSGKDPYNCIPQVALFLGHTSYKQSEYYLRLTAAMHPNLIKLDNCVVGDIVKINKILEYNEGQKVKEGELY